MPGCAQPKFSVAPYLTNQNLGRYEIDDEISITILVFILNYFQEKQKQKIKKTYFEVILGPFCPNLSKNGFPWKKRLSVFKYFNYVSLRKKKKKPS